MGRSIVTVLTLLAVSGCAGVTDVVSTGPGTYIVASHGVMGWSSGGAQKAKAFQDANDYCKRLGKQMLPINSGETPGGFGRIASGEVEFRCLNPDDPAFQRTAPTPTNRN